MRNAIVGVARVLVAFVTVGFLMTNGASRSHAAESSPPAKKAAPAKKPVAKKTTPKKAAAEEPTTTVESLKQMVEGEDVRGFRTFCDSWMQKLRDRETYNVANITWTKVGTGGVAGEYLGYGTSRTCIAREEPGKDPIGKITYRETRYRREGATPTAAMGGASTIVEQTDVTEIFRFAKGRWQY